MSKKYILVFFILLLVILLFFNRSGILNRNLSSNDICDTDTGITTNNNLIPNKDGTVWDDNISNNHKRHLNIGFISTDSRFYFTDSSSLREYLETEFDFNFEGVNCEFTFTNLFDGVSFVPGENIDLIFSDSALNWEENADHTNYSLKGLYDAGYTLKNFENYFDNKEDLFTQFYNSLKKTTQDKIYFFPALICPDPNNESLFISLNGEGDSTKEPAMIMERFYNDDYYYIKRGGLENGRFTKKGSFIISATSQSFSVDSFFKQVVYVTSDNENVNIFLDLVFDSKRLQKQYANKLKIKGNQIEVYVPTFFVNQLSALFDEVLLENVTYDIDSIYNCKNVKITYIAGDIRFSFDFEQ